MRRRVDVHAMVDDARRMLLWEELPSRVAAEMACVPDRTWRRWAADGGIPDSVVKSFCFQAALTKLEQAEKDGSLEKELGGELSVARVVDYLAEFWSRWDPLGGQK